LQSIDFYNDYKYCSACDKYVTYLMSIHDSYCTECGDKVRLFSQKDWEEFNHTPSPKKHKASQTRRKTLGFGRAQ